jgi:hypothetical protein
MKNLIVVAVMMLLAGCAGMERSPEAGKPIEFVMDAPGKTKDQLFSSSKAWIAETFVSAKAVIDDTDKDAGRIIAKAAIKHPCGAGSYACGNEYINFTLRIDTKDGKIRTTYTNVSAYSPATGGHFVGLTFIEGTPESRHDLWMAGELADANKAFKDLSDSLLAFTTADAAASKSW